MTNTTSADKEAEATQAWLIAAGSVLLVVLIVVLYVRGWSGRCCETGVAHVVQRCKKKKKWGYTWVDGDEKRIYLGTKPKTKEHVEELKTECGIGGIVTLNQTWELFLTQEEVEGMGVKNIMLYVRRASRRLQHTLANTSPLSPCFTYQAYARLCRAVPGRHFERCSVHGGNTCDWKECICALQCWQGT